MTEIAWNSGIAVRVTPEGYAVDQLQRSEDTGRLEPVATEHIQASDPVIHAKLLPSLLRPATKAPANPGTGDTRFKPRGFA